MTTTEVFIGVFSTILPGIGSNPMGTGHAFIPQIGAKKRSLSGNRLRIEFVRAMDSKKSSRIPKTRSRSIFA